MKEIQTVSIVGLGAIGCAWLSRISNQIPMEQIRVIAGSDRAARYREGVVVNGTRYRFPVVDPADAAEPADLLLFAVKQGQLQTAIEDARGHVGSDTVILSLLNGISSEEIIGRALGADKLLYSLCVGIDAVRMGDETTYSKLGYIPFGERFNPPGALSERVQRVAAFFDRAGVNYQVPPDMLQTLWWKFMINVGINQVTAALRLPYGAVQQDSPARDMMIEAWREVIALSEREGTGLCEADIDACLEIVATLSPDGKTSMLQDVEAGRETELEILGGTVLQLAARHKVDVPVNRMLHRMLQARDAYIAQMRGAGR